MRGRWLPLSKSRRIVADLMYFSRKVPSFPAHRRMHLGPLKLARANAAVDLPWPALVTKTVALLARERPALRRCYLPWPIPHLFEPATSAACIMIERDIDGEKVVLPLLVKDPAALGIAEIGKMIRHAQRADSAR